MSIKMGWIVGAVAAFALLNLIYSVGEMQWAGEALGPMFVAMNPFGHGAKDWWSALEIIFTFKYSFFEGYWEITRWVTIAALGAAFMIGIGFVLIQGLLSAVGGLFRAIRPM